MKEKRQYYLVQHLFDKQWRDSQFHGEGILYLREAALIVQKWYPKVRIVRRKVVDEVVEELP